MLRREHSNRAPSGLACAWPLASMPPSSHLRCVVCVRAGVRWSLRYSRTSVYDLLRLVAFTMEQEVLVGAKAGSQSTTCCISQAAANLIGEAGGALAYFAAGGRFPDLLIFTYHLLGYLATVKGWLNSPSPAA